MSRKCYLNWEGDEGKRGSASFGEADKECKATASDGHPMEFPQCNKRRDRFTRIGDIARKFSHLRGRNPLRARSHSKMYRIFSHIRLFVDLTRWTNCISGGMLSSPHSTHRGAQMARSRSPSRPLLMEARKKISTP